MREAEYHDLVAMWLWESFADVDHEFTLPSGRRPDFVAWTPFETYAIEVENHADYAEVYDGVGQATWYAQELGAVGVLVLPGDEWDGPPRIGDVLIETV